MISIQHEDFDVGAETRALYRRDTGAVVSFTGLVRDLASHGQVDAIELEYYPAMTQASLEAIVAEARARWPLQGVRVIHRVGRLEAGEQIVLVITASAHRAAAFESAAFIMDYLKNRAPFWKKEYSGEQGLWVDAKTGDAEAMQRWRD